MRVSIAARWSHNPGCFAGTNLSPPWTRSPQRVGEDLLKLWREDGLTVLFVTLSAAESSYLSQRVLVMTQGLAALSVTSPALWPR